MSARKFKIPSSARRHIKIEQFSQFVSATRLRHVQAILRTRKAGAADMDGILCICGIDGRYNEGMYELLNYLLFGFFDVRKDELESSGFAEEVIDDLMLMIGPDHVEVYCNPVNYHYLLPYLSHWPGLKFHCLADDEYEGEDNDLSEEFKIRSLIAMVSECKVVGLPYSSRGHNAVFDIMAVEKWPIIQAFALDEFGGGGFFTLKYEVVDVSAEVHRLPDYQDPVSVEMLLTEHYPLLARQWDNMMKCISMALESSSPVISQRKVSEPLQSYFNHGLVGHKGRVDKLPFVLFGQDTDKSKLSKVKLGEKVTTSDLSSQTEGTTHMICQVVSPHNPLVCSRTYFFCNRPYTINAGGTGDGLQHSHDNTALRYSTGIYMSMIGAVLAGIEMYSHSCSVTKAKAKCMETLQEGCSQLDSKPLMDYLTNSADVEFTVDALTCEQRGELLKEGETSVLMKYISLTLYNIPAPGGGTSTSLGSMIFSETFMDSRISVAGSSDVSSDYLILTSAVKRHQLWSLSGHSKRHVQTVPSLPSDQWGEPLMTQGDIYMTGTWTALLPPEKIVLTVWEHGLSVRSHDYGSFTLHGSDVHSVHLYDGDSMTQVALLCFEVSLSDVMIDRLPAHLYAEFDEHGLCRIVFAFNPHTKAHTQLYGSVLPAWKSDSQVPGVERLDYLDPQLEPIHIYLQNKLSLSMPAASMPTGLKRAACDFPDLFGFLEHLTSSCGLHGPVTHDIFRSLTNMSNEEQSRADDKIVVTIITGLPGSEKDTLASTLTAYNKNVINWLVYKQPEECRVDTTFLHRSMSTAAQSRDQWLLTKSTRVILVAPGFCDTTEVIRAMCYHPDHKLRSEFVVGAVTLCVDPLNTFMEHKMTFPMLTALCAQGWVNNIVFTSQTQAPSELLDNIQTLIRSINSDVALLKAEKGVVKRSTDLDLIMSETAFREPSMERARVLLKPSWREGYPHAWPCHPPMRDVLLRFTHPLEKHLTLIKLRSIKNSLKGHPYDGNVYFVHGYLAFSGSSTLVDVQFTPLSGKLVMSDSKLSTASEKGAGEGQVYFMCFTGVGLKDMELRELLNSCVKQRPDKKPFLTRKDVTQKEIDKIHAAHHLDDLPEGWFYNGSQFVSMEGERSHKHPYLEKFIQEYVDHKNAEIVKFNARIDSESYINLWKE